MLATPPSQYTELFNTLETLLQNVFPKHDARIMAEIFCEAEFDGVHTHGLKRLPRMLDEIQQGWIDIDAKYETLKDQAAFLILDGHAAPGPLTARNATLKAIDKAQQNGLALVAVRNTNHWLRPGYYARLATQAETMLLCWTNTMPNMVAHADVLKNPLANIGNNPLAIGIPNASKTEDIPEHTTEDKPIIFDSALSQFSYGKMEHYTERGEALPFAGGYDKGEASCDPQAISEQLSSSAIGWWKGSGLSVMLDLIAALLAGGQSVLEIGRKPGEQNISQIFICIDPKQFWGESYRERIGNLVLDLEKHAVRWPGKSLSRVRAEHDLNGVNLPQATWDAVLSAVAQFSQ